MASAATATVRIVRDHEAGPIPAEVLAGDEVTPDLAAVLADPADPGYVPWRITNRALAEWAMGRLAEARAELLPILERHAEWVARLNSLRERESAGLRSTVAFFTAELERYAAELRAAGVLSSKGATLHLANGRVETTEYQPRIELTPNAGPELAAWVRANWKAPAADAVIHTPPPPPPTVKVSEVKLLVELVAWPTQVVLAPCAHIVDVPLEGLGEVGTGERLHPLTLKVGRGVICPECSAEALLGDIVDTRPAVVDVDGREVPGLSVVPTTITAKVVVDG